MKNNELKNLFLRLKKRLPDVIEEITIQASSLSFYTIFSIVPILLIVLSLLASNPMFNEYYQKILGKVQDPHEVEHLMMDCIAQMIFSSQKNNTPMDHQAYIRCLEAQSRA